MMDIRLIENFKAFDSEVKKAAEVVYGHYFRNQIKTTFIVWVRHADDPAPYELGGFWLFENQENDGTPGVRVLNKGEVEALARDYLLAGLGYNYDVKVIGREDDSGTEWEIELIETKLNIE